MITVSLPQAGVPVLSAAQNPATGNPTIQKPANSRQEAKLMKECQQFEGILIAKLWNEMEKGTSLGDPGKDPGAGTMQGFGIQAAAMGIAGTGGLGIARMLYQELAPRVNQTPSSHPTGGS